MRRVSKSDAATHTVIPGYTDAYEQEIDDWTVTLETDLRDMDLAPFFEGAPNDQCQAHHLGYVIKGRFGYRTADGTEAIFEAGDAFVIGPGHTPIMFEGAEFVAFTPTKEAREEAAVMMPNVMKYAEEHGIDLAGQMGAGESVT